MFGVTDHENVPSFGVHADDFAVHLFHQGAGGVKEAEIAPFGFRLDGSRHSVRRKNEDGSLRNFVQVLNKDGAHFL